MQERLRKYLRYAKVEEIDHVYMVNYRKRYNSFGNQLKDMIDNKTERQYFTI